MVWSEQFCFVSWRARSVFAQKTTEEKRCFQCMVGRLKTGKFKTAERSLTVVLSSRVSEQIHQPKQPIGFPWFGYKFQVRLGLLPHNSQIHCPLDSSAACQGPFTSPLYCCFQTLSLSGLLFNETIKKPCLGSTIQIGGEEWCDRMLFYRKNVPSTLKLEGMDLTQSSPRYGSFLCECYCGRPSIHVPIM